MIIDPYRLPWRALIEIAPRLGDGQVKVGVGFPSHTLREYVKHVEPGAVFRLLTHNFPKVEWADEEWLSWLRERQANDMETRVLGAEPEDREQVEKLIGDGLMEVRLVEDAPTRHIGLIDKPRQIWFEGYHKSGHKAYGCYYADKPYAEVWDKLDRGFEEAWGNAAVLNV